MQPSNKRGILKYKYKRIMRKGEQIMKAMRKSKWSEGSRNMTATIRQAQNGPTNESDQGRGEEHNSNQQQLKFL